MGIEQNLQYVAKGGGCFLEGTLITTPDGDKRIEDLRAGDQVISYNEKTNEQEISQIGKIDVLTRDAYYVINDAVKATAEHPFYTTNGVQEVQNFDTTTRLINLDGAEVGILSYQKVEESVTVYNLLDVMPNNNYYAAKFLVHNKGGSCFVAGTKIRTPTGLKNIEKIRPNDTVVTYNEDNGSSEYATVQSIQIKKVDGYYILNDILKVSATHPMYTSDPFFNYNEEQTEVQDLAIGDYLVTDAGIQQLTKIQFIEKETTVYNLINVIPNHNYYAGNSYTQYLVHNKGGGGARSGGSSHSSSSKSSSGSKSSGSSSSSKSTSNSTGKSTPTAADKSANKSSSKSTTSAKTAPGSKVTAGGKEVQTSAKKPTNSKVTNQAGIAGVDGYSPRFNNGYTAPAGSVVYYPQHSALDYLPWIYLFSQNSPANDSATTVEPSGREVVAQPVKEGVDGLAVFNWILLVVIVLAIVGGIIWGVNKITTKDKPKKSSYDRYW